MDFDFLWCVNPDDIKFDTKLKKWFLGVMGKLIQEVLDMKSTMAVGFNTQKFEWLETSHFGKMNE